MIHEITEKERDLEMSVSSYRKYVSHFLFKSFKDYKKLTSMASNDKQCFLKIYLYYQTSACLSPLVINLYGC